MHQPFFKVFAYYLFTKSLWIQINELILEYEMDG